MEKLDAWITCEVDLYDDKRVRADQESSLDRGPVIEQDEPAIVTCVFQLPVHQI